MYHYPVIYNLILKLSLGEVLERRYEIIAREIGKNKSVIDVGCGYGILAGFLDNTCRYKGIDLNEKFVNCARKKGLDIAFGNVLDKKNYFDCDVTVICDLLHHIIPNDKKLIEICKNKSKRIIICETFTKDKFLNKVYDKFRRNKLIRSLIGDADGINTYENMKGWYAKTKNDVIELLKGYGAKRTINIGSDIIGIIDQG